MARQAAGHEDCARNCAPKQPLRGGRIPPHERLQVVEDLEEDSADEADDPHAARREHRRAEEEDPARHPDDAEVRLLAARAVEHRADDREEDRREDEVDVDRDRLHHRRADAAARVAEVRVLARAVAAVVCGRAVGGERVATARQRWVVRIVERAEEAVRREAVRAAARVPQRLVPQRDLRARRAVGAGAVAAERRAHLVLRRRRAEARRPEDQCEEGRARRHRDEPVGEALLADGGVLVLDVGGAGGHWQRRASGE